MHGNELDIDVPRSAGAAPTPGTTAACANIVTGLGGATGGFPRETGFDITAASEVMAIPCARLGSADLR